MISKRCLIVIFCLLSNYVSAQYSKQFTTVKTSCKFGDYLLKDKDYLRAANEYNRCFVLNTCENYSNDTLLLMSAWSLREFGDYEESNITLLKLKENNNTLYPVNQLVLSLNYFDIGDYVNSNNIIKRLINNDNKNNLRYIDSEFPITLQTANHIYLNNQEAINENLNKLPENYSSTLSRINQDYNFGKYKKPYLAATMSTFLPGLGKIYTGNYLDGLYSLLMIGAATLQSYASFQKRGFDSIGFYIYGGIALYFYGGNIFGSFLSARERNFNKRDKIEDELNKFIHEEF